jgi:peptidyl-tRNA hydrolase
MGSIITQACHASCASLWLYKEEENVLQYVNEKHLPNMHKVVLEVRF